MADGITVDVNEKFDFIKAWLEAKCDEFCRRLAEVGLGVASVSFADAPYDGVNDAVVMLEPIDNGYKITAFGRCVAFIEFGSGVHFNGSGSYKGDIPDGVVGIGQYGKGNGSRDYWFYKGQPGNAGGVLANGKDDVTITHGNPASMPMYKATKEITQDVIDIAREVFSV